MTNEPTLSRADLAQFTGSEHWYRHGLVRTILFTDGAKYLAEKAGAYWLIDEIALAQRYETAVAGEEFQLWKLTVKPDHTAVLACEDGNGATVLHKDKLDDPSFPAAILCRLIENDKGCALVWTR